MYDLPVMEKLHTLRTLTPKHLIIRETIVCFVAYHFQLAEP